MNETMTIDALYALNRALTNATGEREWRNLSMDIPVADILAYPNLSWDKRWLSSNEGMTVAIKERLDEVLTNATGVWCWCGLPAVIPMADILANPDLPWNRLGLSGNKEITLELVDRLEQVLTNLQGAWDWCRLTEFIPVDKVRSRPDLPWDMNCLASNPGITVDDILYMSH